MKIHGSKTFKGQRDPNRRVRVKRVRYPVVSLNTVVKEVNAQNKTSEEQIRPEYAIGEVPVTQKPTPTSRRRLGPR